MWTTVHGIGSFEQQDLPDWLVCLSCWATINRCVGAICTHREYNGEMCATPLEPLQRQQPLYSHQLNEYGWWESKISVRCYWVLPRCTRRQREKAHKVWSRRAEMEKLVPTPIWRNKNLSLSPTWYLVHGMAFRNEPFRRPYVILKLWAHTVWDFAGTMTSVNSHSHTPHAYAGNECRREKSTEHITPIGTFVRVLCIFLICLMACFSLCIW